MTGPDGHPCASRYAPPAHVEAKPPWIRARVRSGPIQREIQDLVRRQGPHGACQEAGCPNISECWEDREATFLIGGAQCSRRCDFCQIDSGKPEPLDREEPQRVADSIRVMRLRYATVTSVVRDDLPDRGAWLYAETVRAIHHVNRGTGVAAVHLRSSCLFMIPATSALSISVSHDEHARRMCSAL